MPTYRILSQTNADYDPALLSELEELYVGGYGILKNSGRYLTQLVGESEERFTERGKITSYQPFFSQVVNNFASALFGQPLQIKPAADASNPDTPGELPSPQIYHAFEKDCDRAGGTFLDLMKALLITALKQRTAIVHLDFPKSGDAAPANKAEEEAWGTDRVYAYEVPVEQLIDWEDGPNGLVWATLRYVSVPRPGPFDARDTIVETFKVWQMENGVAVWRQFDVRYPVNGPTPNPEQDVPETDSGVTSFKRIPLLKMTLPSGLWTGGMIGPQCREHFQRRSSLIGSQNRSLCAIPWVSRGPEIGAEGGEVPSETQQDPNRGADPVNQFKRKGWVVIGSDDKIGFAEPLGHCYELIDKQLERLRDAIFSVTSQMAASITGSSSTALGRSGLSKQKDTESTAKVLGELGSKIRQFATLIYTTISEARKETVIWNAHGLDSYEPEARQQILEEAISLDQVQINSATFKKQHKFRTATRILGPGANSITLDQIKKEIEKSVDEEIEVQGLVKDAEAAEIDARTEMAKAQATSPLGPKAITPPKNPTVLGMQTPAPGGPTGAGPAPGGATKDGKIGPSKAIKMAGTPSEAAGGSMNAVASTMGAKPNGPAGQPLLPDNAHHQTGAHVDAKTVYQLLEDDYKEKDIQWVLTVAWVGPVEVPLGSIDYSNKRQWQASEDTDHVNDFIEAIQNGDQLKPAVLISNPSNDSKFLVCDGHHRALAALDQDVPLVAYVGQVGSDVGPWNALHDSQRGSSQQSQQKSNQSKQQSKQASRQRSLQK